MGYNAGSNPAWVSNMDLTETLAACQKNVQEYPALLDSLATNLGVSADSLTAIGAGWWPGEAAWVFPERNADGDVIGLVRRFLNGKKRMVKDSKRGLSFEVNPLRVPEQATYIPGARNWTRCNDDLPCPLCGRKKWCMVSSENPADPQAVICGATEEGSSRYLGDDVGYLHILKDAGNLRQSDAVLPSSNHPVLIVEGESDTAAALTLGFQAIGKPSASGGHAHLVGVIAGRDVIILGENDAGAGRDGMEKTFEAVKSAAKSAIKLMPPAGIKDLRAWVRRGLTAEDLLAAVQEAGESASSANLLESTAPLDIAKTWLLQCHWQAGFPLLRRYAGVWYRYDGTKYAQVDEKTFVRGDLYRFLSDKTYLKVVKRDQVIVPYEPNMNKISNNIDALSMYCPVYTDPPCWLDDTTDCPGPEQTIAFSNGLLYIPDMELRLNTPTFFSLTSLPYAWNPGAKCPLWLQFINEALTGDMERINLLQEWIGYNMVADTSQEKLMFFVGRPGAGKGTVLEAIRAVLGPGQVASTSFDTLVGDFGLQALVGKLAAILPDAHITRRGDPAKALQILKEISGRDGVSVNRKNKDFLADHHLSCRFTISVNSMPDLPDHERSLDRRILLLHFGECFTGREDTTLKDRLREEAPGIAVWGLEGLTRLRAKGFTIPRSSTPLLEGFRRQSSPVTEFVDEHCVLGPENKASSMMLYDSYMQWCRTQGIQGGSQAKFSQLIQAMYPGLVLDRVVNDANQRVRGLIGIRLSTEAYDKFAGIR